MTRNKFEQQLAEIKRRLLSMGSLSEELIGQSVQSLKDQDVELAKKVIASDKQIDREYVNIEKKIMRTIAMQAPVAGDLRLLLTALKNATDIERLGDYAKDIAEITLRHKDEEYITKLINIPRMNEIALNMIQISLESFETEDADMARQVHPLDDEVDSLYDRTFRLLTTYILENPKNISQAFSLMLVARHLERVADHALNIANRTIYLKEGDIQYI
ncbi:MAG TPA: phosphate signaling complex protein PhoU [Methanomicrobia archaeon]|nr:phosphate signaling complex protein PhoU [Methanomicrobia archaeon]